MNRHTLFYICAFAIFGAVQSANANEQSLCSSDGSRVVQGFSGAALVISTGTAISTCVMASASYGEAQTAQAESDRELLRLAGSFQLAAAIIQVLPPVLLGYMAYSVTKSYRPSLAAAIGTSTTLWTSIAPALLDGLAGMNLGFVVGNDAVQRSIVRLNEVGAYVNAGLSALSTLLFSVVVTAVWIKARAYGLSATE